MRLAGLFKRLLRLERVRVVGIEIVEQGEGEAVVVDLARRERRRMRCGRCGRVVRAVYDRSLRSWRHLDLVRVRCILRAEVRRVCCPECGVVAEEVAWARAGSRHTRGFEDACVWLARSAPKVVVAQLMRVDWATVGRMIERVVTEHARARSGDGLGRASADRHRRGRLPQGPPLPDLHRGSRHGAGGLGRAGALAAGGRCVLCPARARALPADRGGLGRPSRGLACGDPRLLPHGGHLRRPLPRREAGHRRAR